MNQVCEISLVKSFGFSHNFKRIFLIQSNTFSFVMALCSRPRSIIDGDNKHRNHLRDNENEEDEDVEDDSDRLSLIENNQIDSFRVDNFLIYRMDRFDKVDRFFKLFYHYYYCDEGDRIAIIISDGIRPNPMKHSRLRIRISLINFFRFFIITIIIIIIVVVIKLINLSHKTIPKSISTRTYDTLMMNSDQNLLLLSPISSSSSSSSSSLSSPPKSALTLKFKCESRPSSSIFRITTPIKLLILSLLVLLQSFRCLNHQCRFQINRLLQIIFSSRQIITDISNEQRSKDRLRQHRQIISSLILINFIGSYLLQQPLIVVAMINQNHIKSNQIEEYSIKNIFSRTDPSISASLIMNTDSRRNFSSKFLHQRYTDSIELKRLKRSNNLHRHHHQHHPHYLDLFNQSHQSNLRSMSMMLGKNVNRNSRLLSDNNLSQTYHHQHQLQHRFLNHPRLSSPYRINNNNNNKQSHTRTSTSTSTPLITQTKSSPSVTNHSKPRHSVIPSTLNWSSRLGASSLKPLLLSSKSFAALQNNTLFGRATMIKSNSMSDQRTQMKMNQRITQRQCPEGPPKQWDQRLNAASKALLAPVVFYGQLISLAEDYGGRIGATFRSIRFIKPDLKTITNKNHYRYLSGNGTEHLDDDDENDALINLLGAKNQSKNHEIHIKLYFVREQNETIGSTLCPLFMKNIWDKLRTKERYILFAHRQVLFSRDYKISTSSSTKVNPFINNNNARSVPDDNWYNQATTQHRHKQHQKLYLNPFHHSSSSGSPSAHINNHAGQHHQLISLVAYAEPEILNRTTGRLVRKILCKGCGRWILLFLL